MCEYQKSEPQPSNMGQGMGSAGSVLHDPTARERVQSIEQALLGKSVQGSSRPYLHELRKRLYYIEEEAGRLRSAVDFLQLESASPQSLVEGLTNLRALGYII